MSFVVEKCIFLTMSPSQVSSPGLHPQVPEIPQCCSVCFCTYFVLLEWILDAEDGVRYTLSRDHLLLLRSLVHYL